MTRIVHVCAIVVALLFAGAAPASGQVNVTNNKFKNVYTSAKGFSISLPQGWQARDAKIEFYAPATKDGFDDQLKLTMVPSITLTSAVVRELKGQLLSEYKSMYMGFRFTRFKKRIFGKFPGVHVVGKYTQRGAAAVINQALITTPKGTIIVTCTMKASRAVKHGALCERSFATVRLVATP